MLRRNLEFLSATDIQAQGEWLYDQAIIKAVQALGEKFAYKSLNAQSWDPLMDPLYKEEESDLNGSISEIA